MMVSMVVNHFIVYSKTSYEVDIVRSYLATAKHTQDIPTKATIILQTLDRLKDYHGNSEWLFPTENTNIDTTKALFKSIATDILNQNEVKEASGKTYLTLPHNELVTYLDTQIEILNIRIATYGQAMYWNPQYNLFWYIGVPAILAIVFIGLPITIYIAGLNSYDWERSIYNRKRKKQ